MSIIAMSFALGLSVSGPPEMRPISPDILASKRHYMELVYRDSRLLDQAIGQCTPVTVRDKNSVRQSPCRQAIKAVSLRAR